MPRPPNSRLWTPEDDHQLKSMAAAGCTPAEIATKLQRTIWAVQARARVFHISFKRVKVRKVDWSR
jgi:hypothetical protein